MNTGYYFLLIHRLTSLILISSLGRSKADGLDSPRRFDPPAAEPSVLRERLGKPPAAFLAVAIAVYRVENSRV